MAGEILMLEKAYGLELSAQQHARKNKCHLTRQCMDFKYFINVAVVVEWSQRLLSRKLLFMFLIGLATLLWGHSFGLLQAQKQPYITYYYFCVSILYVHVFLLAASNEISIHVWHGFAQYFLACKSYVSVTLYWGMIGWSSRHPWV